MPTLESNIQFKMYYCYKYYMFIKKNKMLLTITKSIILGGYLN